MKSVIPDRPARAAIGVALATWVGVAVAGAPVLVGAVIGIGGPILTATARSRPVVAATLASFCALGMASGTVVGHRTAALERVDLPSGSSSVGIRVAEDATEAAFGLAIGEIISLEGTPWRGPRVGLAGLPAEYRAGWSLEVEGDVRPGVRRVRDEIVAGTIHIDVVAKAERTPNPIVSAGNAIRDRVADRYDGTHGSDGLLSGFLTGDTDRMSAADTEALRLAGLSHFVAVSGSNVALFLGVWWLVTAPLSIHRRLRVAVGAVGLILFTVVTRWEPSVVRACVMAGTVLVAGSMGFPIDPWAALGVAVTVLLLASGQLAYSLGFQLSVLATAGVLVGLALARGRRPRWLFVPLFSTIGAQLAVAPLLLLTFGSVPFVAPLTNLVAAPLIAATTALAGLGVAVPVVAHPARSFATLIQSIADAAAVGPQLGPTAFVASIGVVAAMFVRPLRAPAAAVGLVVVTMMVSWSSTWPNSPELTVLDVGQGDAILIRTADRRTLLMDGGANPRVLDRALRRHGVRSVDTIVVSHSDIDHAGGLVDLVNSGRVGRLVVSEFVDQMELVDSAVGAGVPVVRVRAGARLDMDSVRIEVLSPARKFESDNDGSIVLLVSAGTSVLLPGDIEAVAQRELPAVHPDVIVVPHHGSATTDPRWFSEVIGDMAVLSYGPNRYGHPHPDIVAALDQSGAEIRHTRDGDVTVRLGVMRTHVTAGR